jgi:hypothetical protein
MASARSPYLIALVYLMLGDSSDQGQFPSSLIAIDDHYLVHGYVVDVNTIASGHLEHSSTIPKMLSPEGNGPQMSM